MNDESETGFIGMNLITHLRPSPTVNFRDMMIEAMPIRFLHLHKKNCRTNSNSFFLEKYVIPSFFAINAPLLKFTSLSFHYCTPSNEAVLSKLQQHGIPLSCIPTALGGLWSYDSFDAWFAESTKRTSTNVNRQEQHSFLEVSPMHDLDIGCEGYTSENTNMLHDHSDISMANQSVVYCQEAFPRQYSNTALNGRPNENTTPLVDRSDDSTSSQRFVDCPKQQLNILEASPIHDFSMECKGTSLLLDHSHHLLPNAIIFDHQTQQTHLEVFPIHDLVPTQMTEGTSSNEPTTDSLPLIGKFYFVIVISLVHDFIQNR